MFRKTLALSLAFAAAFACSVLAQEDLKVGSIVAAKWSDGSWYRGKIAAIKNEKFSIDYDDGDKATLGRSDLMPVPKAPKVVKGQKVFAMWTDKKFYTARVSEVKKAEIVVDWDDGSGSMAIAYGYFIVGTVKAESPATVPTATGASVTLWYEGSRVGSVEPDGEVWIQGSKAGEIGANGRIWKNGSPVGEIGANGKIWKDGSIAGEVERNGRVWKDGSVVGEIERDGRIWKNGSVVGEAAGLKTEWAAAVYFFFFIDD